MYQNGNLVIYGSHGACRILKREIRRVDRKDVEYLVLEPVDQPETRFYVPTGNPIALSKLRSLTTAQELDALLHSRQVQTDGWIPDENQRKQRYRELIGSGDRAALLQMVVSLHRRKEIQTAAGRKLHLCDENFLRDAEKMLHSELSLVLNMEQGEVGSYLRNLFENPSE